MATLSLLVPRALEEDATSVIANTLSIPVVARREDIVTDYFLEQSARGLSLARTTAPRTKKARSGSTVCCDFVGGDSRHRRLYGGGSGQALSRAVGLSSKFKPLVADLTAGLGRDAFVLAGLGARVTMVERNAVVYSLLADGLKRLQQAATRDNQLLAIAQRLALTQMDALRWMQAVDSSARPDIVYLDPMFPARPKSALVKKEMAMLHELLGVDADADDLLEPARACARYRVVVKRARLAPALAGIAPGYALSGKTTRFDVYPLRKLPG